MGLIGKILTGVLVEAAGFQQQRASELLTNRFGQGSVCTTVGEFRESRQLVLVLLAIGCALRRRTRRCAAP